MVWNICFAVSVAVFILAFVLAVLMRFRYKNRSIITPFRILAIGVFAAVYIGLIPVFIVDLDNMPVYFLQLVFINVIQTIQVFTVNVGADFIMEYINQSAESIRVIYATYMSVLFFIAPVLTFGFFLSLFENVLADLLLGLHVWGDVFVFSTINEKSIMLAADLKKHHPKAVLVFADVDHDNCIYIEEAKELRAFIFQKDMLSINLMHHSQKSDMTFFAINEQEDENLALALQILKKYQNRKHTSLYMLSSGAEGELLLSNAQKGCVKVRRVNEIRSLVYQYLYEDGIEIFEHARQVEQHRKEIHAVVLGMGQYGTELVKALSWYCQMDGYDFQIHAVDQKAMAEEKFEASCPELIGNTAHFDDGQCAITIHAGLDINTKSFVQQFQALREITSVFVCLGDDEENINAAVNMRMLCERMGIHPQITTILYSTDAKNAMLNIQNSRGQEYQIHVIGDASSCYSEKVIMGSELERLALQRHLKWGREEEFWNYEYNYRSSMASAIHMRARMLCRIPGMEKRKEQLSDAEREQIERLEHRRWSAYMRSEGYVYSGSHAKDSRNDLGKMHPDLVNFEMLTKEDKIKDSNVGTI